MIDKIQRKRQSLVNIEQNDAASKNMSTIHEEEGRREPPHRGSRLERIEEEMEVTQSKEEQLRDEFYQLELQINLYEDDVNRDRDFIEKQRAIVQERCAKAEVDLEVSKC